MKRSHFLRLVLVLALPCAGFLLARKLARPQPTPPAATVAPAPPVARVAERRSLLPESPPAAPQPVADAGSDRARWVELNNEATSDLAAGAIAAAVEKFERCHAADPANAVFTGNLVESLVRLAKAEHERGELVLAVQHLERAIELGSEREDRDALQRILERWRRELELVQDDWTDDSDRFELTFDRERKDLLHHSHEVLQHLELSYETLKGWFGVDPLDGAPPLRVVLYDPEDFDRLTGIGDWAGGVFDGVLHVSVRDLTSGQGWKVVLVHELVHAFVQAIAGSEVPGWLNEGLAQMLEGRQGASAAMVDRLRGQEIYPLERLVGSLAGWEDSAAIARAYAESLLFVEFLRTWYGDEALRRMLKGIAAGQSPAVAFQERTSVPLEVAFQDWKASLER